MAREIFELDGLPPNLATLAKTADGRAAILSGHLQAKANVAHREGFHLPDVVAGSTDLNLDCLQQTSYAQTYHDLSTT
jgi:hypothetical protein